VWGVAGGSTSGQSHCYSVHILLVDCVERRAVTARLSLTNDISSQQQHSPSAATPAFREFPGHFILLAILYFLCMDQSSVLMN